MSNKLSKTDFGAKHLQVGEWRQPFFISAAALLSAVHWRSTRGQITCVRVDPSGWSGTCWSCGGKSRIKYNTYVAKGILQPWKRPFVHHELTCVTLESWRKLCFHSRLRHVYWRTRNTLHRLPVTPRAEFITLATADILYICYIWYFYKSIS